MRLGTANTYDNTLANLTARQAGLADLQEKLSAGKKVVRASDDPTSAAMAERAMTRIDRIEVEQRALNIQRNSMSMVESTLGDSTDVLQRIRELIVSAGDGSYNSVNRGSIAQEIAILRDQLFGYTNKVDSNGVPLFGGLGSASQPFTDPVTGVIYNGLSGQRTTTPTAIPGVLDGRAVWMSTPSGNGSFTVNLGNPNATPVPLTAKVHATTGKIVDATLAGGAFAAPNNPPYSINFSVSASGTTTYTVLDNLGATIVPAQPYSSGATIQFKGLSYRVEGTPANGDKLTVAAAPTINTGDAWTDAGQVINPSLLTGNNYVLNFSVSATTPPVTTYTVTNTTTGGTPIPAPGQTYSAGQAIQFDGLSFVVQGTPANGDAINLAPSSTTNIFDVIDQVVSGIRSGTSNMQTQSYTKALSEIDAGMNRIQMARSLAGELLNIADNIETNQDAKSDQVRADRSRAEDIDMVKGISDFQNQQTGYDAALKTYAQVQRLSLFNYLG